MLQENNFFRCSILPIVDYVKQWGFRSDTGYGGRTVTFPIAFTKQCFNGHVTTKRGGDSSNGNNYVDKLTTTNMWTVCDGGGGYWFAIGV